MEVHQTCRKLGRVKTSVKCRDSDISSIILLGSRSFSWLTFFQSATRLTTCRLTENAEQLAAKEMFSKQITLFKDWNTQSVVSCFISFLALISSVRGILTEDVKGEENSRNSVEFQLSKAPLKSFQLLVKELNSCQVVSQFEFFHCFLLNLA